jgi:hypothetical protein
MIAIVLGFKTPGPTGEFDVLYSGRDATAAQKICVSPPAGFVRTEMFKNPSPNRRRYHVPAEPEPELEPEAGPDPDPDPAPEPRRRK